MLRARRKFHYVRSALLLGTGLSFLPGMTLAAEEGTAPNALETIVVTAQKREENLQVVPVAVTAINSAALEGVRFENVRDLNAIAPGVSVRTGAGGSLNPSFSMRGIYGTGTVASDSGVAIYQDGLYIANPTGLEVDMADVERVEVLRGPQGTLFGRNAIGGAVNVITKEPSGVFHARQQFSVGNLGQFRSKTTVDLPAWGLVSGSFTFLHDEAKGDIRNLGAGTVWNFTAGSYGRYGVRVSPETLGAHDTNAVNAAVKLETESGVKAIYRFSYSHKDFTPDGTAPTGFVTGPATNFLASIVQSATLNEPAALRSPVTLTRPNAVNNWYSTEGLNWATTHNVTVTVPIADGITLKNLTGYRRMHLDTTNQLDGVGGVLTSYIPPQTNLPGLPLALLQGLNAGPAGTPFLGVTNSTQSDQKTFENEVQINIDNRWVTSTVGYLYYHDKGNQGPVVNAAAASGLLAAPYIGFAAPVGPEVYHTLITTISNAVYTQDQVHVLKQLDLVGGVRYTKDTRHGIDGSPTPAGLPTQIQYSKGTWTYLAGLNYKFTDDIFAYAHYSTGYISGGQLANVQFAPQTAKSWEAGVKADMFEKTLRVNAALFDVKYTGVQLLTNPTVGCAAVPGVAKSAAQCIVNGGDARAKGLELEATYVTPLDGLTLSGNLGYTDFYYTSVNAILRAPDGTFVPQYIPAWTGELSATYTGPEMDAVNGAHIVGQVETDYTSSQYPNSNSTLPILIATKIPSKWIVNGRIGLGGIKVAGAEVEVVAYAKNLLDNKAMLYNANIGFDTVGLFERAREFGVNLTAGF